MTWINSQRKSYVQGKLSNKKIKMLEDIGFRWNVNTDKWDDIYDILKEFVELNGRLPKSKETYKGVSISLWLKTQRRKAEEKDKTSLTDEQKAKLLELGVQFYVSNYMRSWMESYTLCAEYKALYNKDPKAKTEYKGKKIGCWIYNQKRCLKTGKLSPDRVELLKKIGITAENI